MGSVEIRKILDDGEGSTVVLWVSRHYPLKTQINALRMKLGKVRIIQVNGIVPSAEYVIELARKYGAKVIVAVLPLSFIAKLVEEARKLKMVVLFARMKQVAQVRSIDEAKQIVNEFKEARTMTTYADGTIKIHEFVRFERVIAVKLETEPF